jgi:DnaJ-domain-containing protein 1
MNFVDRVWALGRVARDLGNSAAELVMQQPNVRRRVDEVKAAARTARATVEAQMERAEHELWGWINEAQERAQKAHRQTGRARSAANHYRVLGVERGADLKVVKRAWRNKMRDNHPDRFAHDPRAEAQAHARAQELNLAYQELTALLTGRESRRAG